MPYVYKIKVPLTLNLLTTTIVAPPSNASKWQMGFNSAFKGLILLQVIHTLTTGFPIVNVFEGLAFRK
jgi:hypothetical protein